jgi:hypothetical protein
MDTDIFDDIMKEHFSLYGTVYMSDMLAACKAAYNLALTTKKEPVVEVPCSAGLCATTQADLKGEILDRMNYFYLQTDGTHKWPNNAEGDLLKMAHKFISA